jgi:hypothetical protein
MFTLQNRMNQGSRADQQRLSIANKSAKLPEEKGLEVAPR